MAETKIHNLYNAHSANLHLPLYAAGRSAGLIHPHQRLPPVTAAAAKAGAVCDRCATRGDK